MKRLFIISAVIIIAIFSTSCEKEVLPQDDYNIEVAEVKAHLELMQTNRVNNPLSQEDLQYINKAVANYGDLQISLQEFERRGDVICVSTYGTHWIVDMGYGIYAYFYNFGGETYVFYYTRFEVWLSGGHDC